MRVAHILPWPTIGGVEHGALRAARAARDSGIESVAFHLRQAWPVERQSQWGRLGVVTDSSRAKRKDQARGALPVLWRFMAAEKAACVGNAKSARSWKREVSATG